MTPLPELDRIADQSAHFTELAQEMIVSLERNWWNPGIFPNEKPPQPDWETLKNLDFDEEFLRLSEWICEALVSEPFSPKVDGLCFGISFPFPDSEATDTLTIFLKGSENCEQDENWAREASLTSERFLFESKLLRTVDRELIRGESHSGEGREVAISLCTRLLTLIVAQWANSPLRHWLRGNATWRKLFIGINPYQGWVSGILTDNLSSEKNSVILSWRGQVAPDDTDREKLLSDLAEIRSWHQWYWENTPGELSEGFAALASLREEAPAARRPAIRHFENTLTGQILLDPEISEDSDQFVSQAREAGLTVEEVKVAGNVYPLLSLEQVTIRGFDFQILDPRGLYPKDDRYGLVFVHSPGLPFLDGLIVAADSREFTITAYGPPVNEADWYLRSPSLHLRNYFLEWTTEFLTWLKVFYVPGLRFSPTSAGIESHFKSMVERHGHERAREISLRQLKLHFEAEADRSRNLGG